MARKNPPAVWTLPEVVDPPERRCMQIPVPDDPLHIAAFRGALLTLSSAYKWADDPAHTAKEVALVWRDIIDGLNWGCDMSDFDVRQNDEEPCTLEKTEDDGVTWTPWANLQKCPPNIRINDGVIEWQDPTTGIWEPVESGDEREDGEAPPPWPDPPPGEDGACLSAENITAFYQTALTQIRGDVVLGKNVTIIAAAFTSLASLFIPAALIGTIALSLSAAALTLGEVGLTIMLDQDHLDQFKCVVYCNAESDGSITSAAFTAIRAGMADWTSGPELFIIEQYLDSFGSVGLQRQGAAEGVTEGHCEECGCNDCPYIDFTGSNYTAIIGTVGAGGIDGGNALQSTTLDGSDGIQLEFSTDTSLCEAESITFWAWIDWSSPYDRNIQYEIRDDTETVLASGTVATLTPERGWYQRVIPVFITLPAETHLWFRTGAEGQPGEFKVTEVQFVD